MFEAGMYKKKKRNRNHYRTTKQKGTEDPSRQKGDHQTSQTRGLCRAILT